MPTAVDANALRLLPSLLDRLLDPESMSVRRGGYTVNEMIEAVRRDVEDLLNNRQLVDPDIDAYPELSKSVFTYGIPELISRPASSGPDLDAIGRSIAEAIQRQEPRLRDVRLILLSQPGNLERNLRFRIEGRLRIEPSPQVEFETVVDLGNGQSAVLKRTA